MMAAFRYSKRAPDGWEEIYELDDDEETPDGWCIPLFQLVERLPPLQWAIQNRGPIDWNADLAALLRSE